MATMTPPELRGLLAIAREEGLDMKPVLLRILTDLYVATPAHSPDEIAQFREIAGTLIPEVDKETALIVACKLAEYPATPLSVGQALIERRDDSSRIILADAAWLPRPLRVIAATGPDRVRAAAVAARTDLDDDLIRNLIERDDPLIDVTLAANTAIVLPADIRELLLARGREEAATAKALLTRTDITGADKAVLFLAADKQARRQVIEEAERLAALSGRMRTLRIAPDDLVVPLETAAMGRDDEAFVSILSLALGTSPGKVRRLLADRSGEPLALALVALGVPDEVAARIFMFRDPMIGHSTERVFALVDLSRRVSPGAAERIIAGILGGTAGATPRTATHVPASDQTATGVRPGAVPQMAVPERRTIVDGVARAS
ncbi:MAG: DUF2336 domain-containing protein [Alsobacter sp.]